ncbi:MAG: DUF4148 domain-containing protein [Burkholderiaceae bacterium]|nr:DUF4148 domain-containing protein [Burkholderiaceae bacterium]
MNVKTLIAAVALTLGSASAFAAGAAPASGEFNLIGNADAALTSVVVQSSGVTRAAVLAELNRARANGELALNGEDMGSVARNQADQPGLTRAAVVAAIEHAPASGEFAG